MLSNDYVLGLVDGEGSFNVALSSNKRRSKVVLRFNVKLRHQDQETLYGLQRFFGCGKIYIQRDNRKNHSLCYRFEVQSKADIQKKIIPFFEKNLPKLESRKRDFLLFKEISDLSSSPDNLRKIQALKNQMHWGLAVYGKTVRAGGTHQAEEQDAMPVKSTEQGLSED